MAVRQRKTRHNYTHVNFDYVMMPDGTIQRVSAQQSGRQIAIQHQEGAKDNRR